jgi:glucose 1-dehydrogenase
MGRAIGAAFTAAGASVVLADVDAAGGAESERLANEAGAGRSGTAVFVATDVTDEQQVAAAVAVAMDRFGRLDHAVNAAAIEGERVPLHETPTAGFERMQDINVSGLYFSMKHELAAMLAAPDRAERGGSIVNLASTSSFRPQRNQTAYVASKHAVLGLTRSAAIDYGAKGVRINAICPGGIDTPMLRNAMERSGAPEEAVIERLSLNGRFGRPDEIAAAALWLCSDGASYTMGHPLAVDAGYLAR